VDDLSLALPDGCVFGFIGRNGAGKTTTIRMMMGLLEATAGTVRLGGHDIAREPEAAKAITGYVPDRPYLYDKLTAEELLRFVGGLYGIERTACAARSTALLEEFALAERRGELIETYSHGMKQRLALAAALIHRPRILVLDEPMVGLDPQGALDLRRLLRKLAGEGVTIFLSTHSLTVAEELCGTIGVLDRGRLVAFGDLAELRARRAAESNGAASNGADHASLESVFLDLVGAAEGQW
jgi:ABC-2 type transport system ATP-binding protein